MTLKSGFTRSRIEEILLAVISFAASGVTPLTKEKYLNDGLQYRQRDIEGNNVIVVDIVPVLGNRIYACYRTGLSEKELDKVTITNTQKYPKPKNNEFKGLYVFEFDMSELFYLKDEAQNPVIALPQNIKEFLREDHSSYLSDALKLRDDKYNALKKDFDLLQHKYTKLHDNLVALTGDGANTTK